MNSKMKSFVKGILLGMVSKPLPISQGEKEPVAYLYGHVAKEGETPTHTIDGVGYVGAVLPKLPEWDREAYPYAATNGIRLVASSTETYWDDALRIPSGTAFLSWTDLGNGWSDVIAYPPTFAAIKLTDEVLWSNHDVLDTGSNVHLAASNPVPVYE